MNTYYIYFMSNVSNDVLYIGVTNNLLRRCYEHKAHLVEGFTKKYNVTKLVYYESSQDIESAIQREKQFKGWRRDKKNKLINAFNPEWDDLYPALIGDSG
jgi:putative endonuclease